MKNELFERELQNTSINDVSLADYVKENYLPISVLDEIRAEIGMYEADCRLQGGSDDCERCNTNVFGSIYRILHKYKAENDHKCHTCKHYTSGENDGSCGSYVCKGYSNWESEG